MKLFVIPKAKLKECPDEGKIYDVNYE